MDIRGDGQRQYWSNRALTYGHQYGLDTVATQIKIRRKVEVMGKYLDFNVPKMIEFGCGTGLFTKEFSRLNKNLLATDLSTDMIAVAKKACPNVNFMQVDARDTKIPDGSYDLVVSSFLLQHVDIWKVLPEMSRILKSGGYFGAIIPNILNPIHYGRSSVNIVRKILHENSDAKNFTRWKWDSILSMYNLKTVCIKPIEFTSPYIPTKLVPLCIKVSQVLEVIPIVREFAGTIIMVARKK